MTYKVIHYSYPTIVVRTSRTKARYTFLVDDDGSLAHDSRSELGPAKVAAIEFLGRRKDKQKTPSETEVTSC